MRSVADVRKRPRPAEVQRASAPRAGGTSAGASSARPCARWRRSCSSADEPGAGVRGRRCAVRRAPVSHVSSTSFLANATESGERSMICCASSSAAASGSSTALARPSSAARSPEKISPVMASRFTSSIGSNCFRDMIPDMSGTRPHFASSTDQWASVPVNLKSAPRAICTPPPKQ